MQETETFEQWLREHIVRLSAQAADLAEQAEKLQGEAHHMTRDLIAVQGALEEAYLLLEQRGEK